MKNIELVIPKLNQYSYEQKLESDSKTMSYNAGYDVSYFGYHYNTGCIDFPKEKWRDTYNKRINENKYFAYIKDCTINRYVGYVNYQYNKNDNIYECGVLIESKYRGKGYSKDALRLLVKEANDTKKYIAQEDEEKVKISSLTDGMKLSKPLKSFDGKEILEADLTLDNDLIWRIWQLSSICPLNSPMVIKKNMKKKSFMDLGDNSSNKITKK